MTNPPKIILWIDYYDYLTFGIGIFLKKNFDVDLYAIIDCTDNQKNFFKTQNFVKFKKIWFLHDYIKKESNPPDLKFLSNFESKSKINLWMIAQNERLFFEFEIP